MEVETRGEYPTKLHPLGLEVQAVLLHFARSVQNKWTVPQRSYSYSSLSRDRVRGKGGLLIRDLRLGRNTIRVRRQTLTFTLNARVRQASGPLRLFTL